MDKTPLSPGSDALEQINATERCTLDLLQRCERVREVLWQPDISTAFRDDQGRWGAEVGLAITRFNAVAQRAGMTLLPALQALAIADAKKCFARMRQELLDDAAAVLAKRNPQEKEEKTQ